MADWIPCALYFVTGALTGSAITSLVFGRRFRMLTQRFRALEIAARQVDHRLVGDAVHRLDDGILAQCTCGWVSRGHFSSMAASAAFREHLDQVAP